MAEGAKLFGMLNAEEYNIPGRGGVLPPPSGFDINSPPKFDFLKGKLRWGGNWLHWKGPGRYDDLIPLGPNIYAYQAVWASNHPEDLRAELIRFLRTLELWEQTPGSKLITAYEVWARTLCEGPDFAETLKDMFDVTWRSDDSPMSYNFVFPARFLPRWESHCDDLKLTLDKTYADADVLTEYEQIIDSIISKVFEDNDITLPEDEEILEERSTTTSYIASEDRTLPHWEALFVDRSFNAWELQAKRCVVPVCPGGFRDTVIADISANNSIRWIERSMRHILQYVPESAVCLYSTTFAKRLEDVVEHKGWHVLRDLKKCGLTYNVKDLFPPIERSLIRYSKDRRFGRLSIFQDMSFMDDGVLYKANRGYFLGMANHVVTLANIAIHYMARTSIPRSIAYRGRAIFGNDDCDVVFNNKNAAEHYLELEHEIHAQLGNLTNYKKSVIKPFGLFYEQYSRRGWKDKESLVCNALACAYLAPDIRTAKLYISSQSERFHSTWSRTQLWDLIQWWGGEFFPPSTEFRINSEVGGWLNTAVSGLKTSLRDLDRLREKYDLIYLSYVVRYCKLFMKPPSPRFKREGLVKNLMYSGPAVKSLDRVQKFTLTDEDLKEYYKKLTTYQRNFDRRKESFYKKKREIRAFKSFDTLYSFVLGPTPWHQIPDSLVDSWPIWTNSMSLTYEHELSSEWDNPTKAVLDKIRQGEKGDDVEFLRWDPLILPKFQDKILICDAEHIFYASQFSNSGVIPLLDYYLGNEMLPSCRPIGRLRFASLVDQTPSRVLTRTSRFWGTGKERTFGERAHPSSTGDECLIPPRWWDYTDPDPPDVRLRNYLGQKEETVVAASKEISDVDYSRLEAMGAALGAREDFHVFMKDAGHAIDEESVPDVFDGSDDDLGLDMF
jgi:hypothetical protein